MTRSSQDKRVRGRPAGSDSAETRTRIIDAACSEFGEVGYKATTFASIALRADLSRPAVHYHFEDKRTLYHAVYEQTNRRAFELGMKRARGESTLMTQMVAFAAGASELGRGPMMFLVTAAYEARYSTDILPPAIRALDKDRRFADWALTEAVRRGECDPEASALIDTDSDLLTSILWGLEFYVGFIGTPDALLESARNYLA
ncbi:MULTISPECIES: TetR/AcrR family transcriptional regulator [Mycolicibacterium]|uniref:TetR family transcriptional regulator n=2 Tax=Mycolicibacterium TaxID=1866885 RepID=A0A4Z0HVE9_MYCPR|nr:MULTISPECIES: TetR/AcrR family transcriptional regulator [Mycolicibacterium]MCV7388769.1 TetR/AcrR family transcriptional regulator [Mycolicibacterium porcinum]ORB34871.1 hypothetical protein BST41_30135 [Mycolicibacterium porcinum]TGB45551.1 TetR family transcriptional regulator [Mycolicibacterium peregrinum]TGB47717.1 TetR family transcriptional regulator [Mycolicibacterium peregrinum]